MSNACGFSTQNNHVSEDACFQGLFSYANGLWTQSLYRFLIHIQIAGMLAALLVGIFLTAVAASPSLNLRYPHTGAHTEVTLVIDDAPINFAANDPLTVTYTYAGSFDAGSLEYCRPLSSGRPGATVSNPTATSFDLLFDAALPAGAINPPFQISCVLDVSISISPAAGVHLDWNGMASATASQPVDIGTLPFAQTPYQPAIIDPASYPIIRFDNNYYLDPQRFFNVYFRAPYKMRLSFWKLDIESPTSLFDDSMDAQTCVLTATHQGTIFASVPGVLGWSTGTSISVLVQSAGLLPADVYIKVRCPYAFSDSPSPMGESVWTASISLAGITVLYMNIDVEGLADLPSSVVVTPSSFVPGVAFNVKMIDSGGVSFRGDGYFDCVVQFAATTGNDMPPLIYDSRSSGSRRLSLATEFRYLGDDLTIQPGAISALLPLFELIRSVGAPLR
jgi:hypothetical protein